MTAVPNRQSAALSSAQPSKITTSARRWRAWPWLLLALIILGTALRLYNLTAESLWVDEFIMVDVTNSVEDARATIEGGRPPVFVVLGTLWSSVFGQSVTTIRLLPLIGSVLGLIALFAVGRTYFNPMVGLIAVLIAVLAPQQIYHAQDYRYYAWLLLFTLLSYLFLYRMLQRGRWLDMALYVVFGVLMFYTHSYGAFVLFGQGLAVLLLIWRRRNRLLQWVLSQVLILAGISIGLYQWFFKAQISGIDGAEGGITQAWLTTPAWSEPIKDLVRFYFYEPQELWIAIAAAALIVGGVVWLAMRGMAPLRQTVAEAGPSIRSRGEALTLIVFWLLIPIVTPFVLSYVIAPIYYTRYVITAAPAIFLLTAALLWGLRRVVPLGWSLSVLVVLLGAHLIATYYQPPVKEQWDQGLAYIAANQSDDSALIFTTMWNRWDPETVAWYYTGDAALCGLNTDTLDDNAHTAELSACVGDAREVWVLGTDALRLSLEELAAFIREMFGYELVDTQSYFSMHVFQFEPTSQ